MALSTNLISGLSSGFDWRSMIDQLMAVEHRPVDLVTAKKTDTETKLTEWQTANAKLLALKTAATGLKNPDTFQVFAATLSTNSSTVEASDLLSVSTSTTTAPGTYSLKVTTLAQAQKLSSNPFTSQTTALGEGYAGDIVINGKVVTINATDTLAGIANSINNLNTGSSPSGVTASVINFGVNDYRLILTSDKTGAEGISLLNGSSINLVQAFGWKDNQAAMIKNSITLGAQSDRFISATSAIGSLLSLTTAESGTVTIGGQAVAINLSMSLTDIKIAINNAAPAGMSASVIEEIIDNTKYYRLQIDGTQTFLDDKNILNTLGVLDRGSAAVSGKVSGISMTSNGSYITAATVLKDIDGYNTFTAGGSPAGDYITLTGTDTSNVAVSANFNIASSTTVQDLLDEIETHYGNVLAYVTSDGKIRVDDLSGGSVLVVNLTDHIADASSTLEFVTADANFAAAAARQRQIIAGADASITLDGVTVTNASNTIKDVIAGTTLNLIKEDGATTVNLTVGRDLDAIKNTIQDFVGKYNDLMAYINVQFSYDTEKKTAGGVLFGDGTLSSAKSDISALITGTIWGVNSNFSIMGMIGINLDNNQLLTIDDTLLTGYLQTNFNDVKALFSIQGTTSNTSLAYITSTRDSEAGGPYMVHIDRAATRATETGSGVNLATGGAEDTLTVTQGSATATIDITTDMTLTDIVNAINTEFNAVYTQTLSGSLQLKQDDNVTAITAGTTWDNIFGTTLEDPNNVITFSGTSRSGTEISGSYTITNTATDTVQDLLSAIENAYSNQVTASISSSGHITLTDKFTGTSQLALDITESVGSGLDFGTVLTSNTGGVVGRYALALTADDDGSNHLVIQNNDYGDGSSFTVSQGAIDLNYDQMIYTTTANTTVATNGAAYVTGATTWSDVYGADVTNGVTTITINGMSRTGTPITEASYVINDKTTDTINGLLTAIEGAVGWGTTVDAIIRDGKIYLEDTTAGTSSIALTLTVSGGTLALGSFNQSTTRDMDLGLVNGTYTGQDVAGTIKGETATGSGQNLTGAAGNANTAGLSVKYTGSTNGSDAGTVTLTLGLAALLDNILFNITDSVSGYVPFKQQSLQDSVDRFSTQISEMEARLSLKQEAMVNRFVAMEVALSKIQSQSAWLAGQINAASNGWR